MTSLRDHIRKSPHRTRLERLLKATLPTLSGEVLDIGSRNRRYDHLFKNPPVAVDIIEDKEKNIQFGDVNNLQFRGETFNAVVCLEVLEYVSDPKRAISELRRVLKSGGTLVLSIPFMFREHEDKLRYTATYLRGLLADFDIVQFVSVGGAWTVICTIAWGKVKSIKSNPLRYLLAGALLPFLIFRSRNFYTSSYASGHFIVAKKRL